MKQSLVSMWHSKTSSPLLLTVHAVGVKKDKVRESERKNQEHVLTLAHFFPFLLSFASTFVCLPFLMYFSER